MEEQIIPDPRAPKGMIFGFDSEYVQPPVTLDCKSDDSLKVDEAYGQWLDQLNAHWLKRVHDGLWDDDVPWEMTVPRFQYEPSVLDSLAATVEAAYHAGRRSAVGQADAYWEPPAAPEQN